MDEQKIKIRLNQVLVVFFAVLVIAIVYSLIWGPAAKFAESFVPSRTFSVNAEGKVVVSPDIAKLSFSVVSEGPDPEKLADENNKKMNEAIAFVKEQGIEEKDVKTTQYNLSPRYSYDRQTGKSYIYSYELTQTIFVKIRDFAKIGKILAGLPEYGINQISSISFEVDEPENYLAEARTEAFQKAKEKADKMAKDARVKLGRIINFGEYQGGTVPRYEALGIGGGETLAKSITPPSIEPGSQEITVQVTVTYEIR